MRLNVYIAQATGMSRRAADTAIAAGRVEVNGQLPVLGQQISDGDIVKLDSTTLGPQSSVQTIMLNKPVGYVCSRDGQGSKTVYDLLPPELHGLKPVGRLDKDSSGLLLMTTDGKLAHELTHPSFQKTKVYEVRLDKTLSDTDKAKIRQGVLLEDGVSRFEVRGDRLEQTKTHNLEPMAYIVRLHEGRNRQIRRTFAALGYTVTNLHRTQFGDYQLKNLVEAEFIQV